MNCYNDLLNDLKRKNPDESDHMLYMIFKSAIMTFLEDKKVTPTFAINLFFNMGLQVCLDSKISYSSLSDVLEDLLSCYRDEMIRSLMNKREKEDVDSDVRDSGSHENDYRDSSL